MMITPTSSQSIARMLEENTSYKGFLYPKTTLSLKIRKIHTTTSALFQLKKELTELEEICIIYPSTLDFTLPVITVPRRKAPSMYKLTFRMVVGFRKVNQ